MLIFSGEAIQVILFKMLAPIGLFLTFIGVVISFIGWLLMIKDAIEEKAELDVKGLIFIGIIIFLIPILKNIFQTNSQFIEVKLFNDNFKLSLNSFVDMFT